VPVILYAEFTAKPSSETQVQMLISDLADKVRQEPGNTEFTVYRERDNSRKFFVFEEYLDEASFEAHIQPHRRGGVPVDFSHQGRFSLSSC